MKLISITVVIAFIAIGVLGYTKIGARVLNALVFTTACGNGCS